jgi:hypothetical protein
LDENPHRCERQALSDPQQPERERLLAWRCRTAIREAIKLDRRAQRASELVDADEVDTRNAGARNPTDAQLAARDVIVAARLRAREAEVLALQVAGCTYTRQL